MRRKGPAPCFRIGCGGWFGVWCVLVVAGEIGKLPGSSSFPLSVFLVIIPLLLLALGLFLLAFQNALVLADVVFLLLRGVVALLFRNHPAKLVRRGGRVGHEKRKDRFKEFFRNGEALTGCTLGALARAASGLLSLVACPWRPVSAPVRGGQWEVAAARGTGANSGNMKDVVLQNFAGIC